MRLSEIGIRRARLHAQLLGGKVGDRRVPDVVSAVTGVQAQDLAAAALCIRARSPGLAAVDVAAAARDDRSIALTWSLRGTRHLHDAADLRWLVALLGPLFNRPGRREEQLGIAGDVGDRAAAAVQGALRADGPLTRREIKERLAPLGIDVSGQAPIHVLQRAALEGTLVIVPDPQGDEQYVLTDDWLPPGEPVDAAKAPAMLARRFLAAHGPATPKDFRAWSGLPAALAESAWAGVERDLEEVDGPRGAQWILRDRKDAVLAAATDPGPLRLTGGFDTLLLGYADRTLFIAAEDAPRVNAGGGLIKPTVVDDGRIVGTWRYLRELPGDRIAVDAFREVDRKQLTSEVGAVGRFLGRDPVLDLAVSGW